MDDIDHLRGEIAILQALTRENLRAAKVLESYGRLVNIAHRCIADGKKSQLIDDILVLITAYSEIAARHPDGLAEKAIAESWEKIAPKEP